MFRTHWSYHYPPEPWDYPRECEECDLPDDEWEECITGKRPMCDKITKMYQEQQKQMEYQDMIMYHAYISELPAIEIVKMSVEDFMVWLTYNYFRIDEMNEALCLMRE